MTADQLLPVEDEDLGDVVDSLIKGNKEQKKPDVIIVPDLEVIPETNGIVIGDKKRLMFYNTCSRKLTTLVRRLPGTVACLAYFEDELWAGLRNPNDCVNGVRKSRIITLKNPAGYMRDGKVNCIFQRNGVLYDAGSYGIVETKTGNKVTVKPVCCVFPRGQKLLAVTGGNIRELDDVQAAGSGKKLAMGQVYQSCAHDDGGSAVSIKGHIVSALGKRYLENDGNEVDRVQFDKETAFKCVAYNPHWNQIYAGGSNMEALCRYKVTPGKNMICLKPDGVMAKGLSKDVNALLPVTPNQAYHIGKQARDFSYYSHVKILRIIPEMWKEMWARVPML